MVATFLSCIVYLQKSNFVFVLAVSFSIINKQKHFFLSVQPSCCSRRCYMLKASELLFDAVFDRELGVIWIFNDIGSTLLCSSESLASLDDEYYWQLCTVGSNSCIIPIIKRSFLNRLV